MSQKIDIISTPNNKNYIIPLGKKDGSVIYFYNKLLILESIQINQSICRVIS